MLHDKEIHQFHLKVNFIREIPYWSLRTSHKFQKNWGWKGMGAQGTAEPPEKNEVRWAWEKGVGSGSISQRAWVLQGLADMAEGSSFRHIRC